MNKEEAKLHIEQCLPLLAQIVQDQQMQFHMRVGADVAIRDKQAVGMMITWLQLRIGALSRIANSE